MKVKTNRWVLVGLLWLLASLLTACSGPDEHIWLKSPGWSRAVFLGNTAVNDPVPMALDDDGNIYFVLVTSNTEHTQSVFSVIALDSAGQPLWEHALDGIRLHTPDTPKLIWQAGHLQVFWMDNGQLFTLPLAAGGEVESAPVLLSGDRSVETYSLAVDASGAYTLWFAGSRKDPGVIALSALDGSGEMTVVDPQGVRVQLAYDQLDTLHALWLDYPLGYGVSRVRYALYSSRAHIAVVEPRTLYEVTIGPSNALDGPVMGIDTSDVYVFWTIIIRTGLESGTIRTSYIHFPLTPYFTPSEPQSIAVPSIYGLQYEYLSNSPLDVGERASLQGSNIPRSVKVQEIMPNPVQADELAIIFRSPMEHLWRKEHQQVNVAYFYEGEPASFQPLSFTTSVSTSPNLLNSPDRHLYATWLEKIETNWFAVYFASTAPSIEQTLSRSTGREVGRVAAQIIFGMLVGVLMAPIAAGVWSIAPLMVLLLFAPLRKLRAARVRNFFTALGILAGITVFWFAKMATLPGMMDYVPFSAWVPRIPQLVAVMLRWGVPILSSLLALFAAWSYTYRQSNKSALYFLLIYIGVDSLLTAAVYAVLIYGAI